MTALAGRTSLRHGSWFRPPRRWGVLGLLVGAWVVACAVQGALAYSHARAGAHAASSARQAMTADDPSGAGGRLFEAGRAFRLAHARASSPVLAPLRVTPVLGRQLRSFAELSKAASQVAGVAATGAEAVDTLLAGGITTGPERLATLRALADRASSTETALGHLRLTPEAGLVEPLRRRWALLEREVASTRAGLRTVAQGLDGVSRVLAGPRRYLLLAANNAEMRAGSGMFLSIGIIETADGSVRIGRLRPAGDLRLPGPGAPVEGDLAARWGWLRPGQEWRNLATTPRFDVTAPLAVDMWERLTGERLDGALAIDVPFLAAVLAATGPVAVGDGTVSEATVVPRLLHDQYEGLDVHDPQAERRDELGGIAAAVVGALEHGDYSPWRLAAELSRASRGRHMLAWSALPDEQRTWERAGVTGALDARSVAVNVLNRGGNKLDPFVEVEAALALLPASDGTEVTLEVTIGNRTPAGQSPYIAGPHPLSGIAEGDYLGIVALNLPGAATDITLDGGSVPVTSGPDGPTQVVAAPLLLPRNQETTVAVRFRLPSTERSVHVVPSARIPAIRWDTGNRQWQDDVPMVVSWQWE